MEPFDTPEQPAERAPDPYTPPLFDLPAQQPFGMPAAPAPTAARGFGRLTARMRNPRRTVLASLVAAALVATGGVALAANNSGTTAPGVGPGMRAAHGMVHGEFTVADGKGGYTTELVQRGTVTSFSGGTLTVKSSDGYTHSYTTDSTTMFGRGHGHGHGFGHGGWMHGPMNPMGKPNQNGAPAQGNAAGSTATPNSAAPSNGTALNSAAPSNGTAPSSTAPNMVMPNNTTPNMTMPNNTTPNNATPNNTTTNTPNITVGETVTVIAVHSGNTDHAQRVMPMPQMNAKQGNGQNGFPGGFFGHHRGGHGMMGQFPGMPGMPGQPGGTAPAMPGTTGPMNNGNNTGPGPMNSGPSASTPANPPTSSAPTVASQSMPNNSANSDSSGNGSDSSTTNG